MIMYVLFEIALYLLVEVLLATVAEGSAGLWNRLPPGW